MWIAPRAFGLYPQSASSLKGETPDYNIEEQQSGYADQRFYC